MQTRLAEHAQRSAQETLSPLPASAKTASPLCFLEAPAAGCGPLKALGVFRPFFWLHLQRERRLCDPLLCEALTSQLNDFDKVTVPNGSEKARHQPMSDEINCDVEIARSFSTF